MKPVIRENGEDIDHLIKRYKRARNKAGISEEINKRKFYKKPGVVRRNKHLRAIGRLSRM